MTAMGDDLQTSARLWDNPYVKGLVWFFGIAVGLVTSAFGAVEAFDRKYAKNDAVEQVKGEVVAQAKKQDDAQKALLLQIEYQADQNRKRTLEDQLFRIDMTPEKAKTQTDRALGAKYKQELNDLNDRWNRAGKPLK
jgi:hypothetical protein